VAALLGAGAVIAGPGGLVVFGGALAIGVLLRERRPAFDRLTLFTAAGGLILAGALLCRYPWRSTDGYIGHSAWVQLPALVALGALAASLLPLPSRWREPAPEQPDPDPAEPS
jgi:arabinofuranan 3-O-arabinosyltransferase